METQNLSGNLATRTVIRSGFQISVSRDSSMTVVKRMTSVTTSVTWKTSCEAREAREACIASLLSAQAANGGEGVGRVRPQIGAAPGMGWL